jgi:hypothetical protein
MDYQATFPESSAEHRQIEADSLRGSVGQRHCGALSLAVETRAGLHNALRREQAKKNSLEACASKLLF